MQMANADGSWMLKTANTFLNGQPSAEEGEKFQNIFYKLTNLWRMDVNVALKSLPCEHFKPFFFSNMKYYFCWNFVHLFAQIIYSVKSKEYIFILHVCQYEI